MDRCLIKLHESSSDVVYKVRNPFAQEKRHFFFFSDPPHLVKTVRNCWQSRKRSLWERMCIICIRLWCINVLFCIFYNRDTEPGMGIRMVPKLKFEHISLTSFSKMHVDLAAQVCTAPSEPMYGSIYQHSSSIIMFL